MQDQGRPRLHNDERLEFYARKTQIPHNNYESSMSLFIIYFKGNGPLYGRLRYRVLPCCIHVCLSWVGRWKICQRLYKIVTYFNCSILLLTSLVCSLPAICLSVSSKTQPHSVIYSLNLRGSPVSRPSLLLPAYLSGIFAYFW